MTLTITYDANGNQTGTSFTWTNPADPDDTRTVTTSNTFDAGDQGTQSTSTSGTTITQYDALGRPFRTTDPQDSVSETTYDRRGLVIQTRSEGIDTSADPPVTVWLVSRTVYDAAGRAVYASDSHPEGTPVAEITGTHTIYDDAGRVVGTEQRIGLEIDIDYSSGLQSPVSSLISAGSLISTSSTVYDDAGRVTETTDAFGRKTQTLYDPFGQMIETRTQSRDETGTDVWLVSRTVFDKFGRAELTTDQFVLASTCALGACASPPVHASRSIYDEQGRVVKTERLKEVVVEIQSGSAVVTDEGSLLNSSETIYDIRGRVSRTIAADGQITDFEFDEQGRQVAEIGHPVPAEDVGLGAAHPGKLVRHHTETEFNVYGQQSRRITNIVQVEDAEGNVETIDRSGEQKTDFEYDEFGNRVKTIFGVGTSVESYTLTRFDSFGRVIAEMQQTAAATTAEWSASENSFVVEGTSTVIPTKLFEYDSDGRLSAVELPAVPDPDNGNTLTRPRYEYGYNEQSNQTLIRDPLGRETRFTFDVQGRQLTRTLPLGFGTDGILSDGEQPTGDFVERFEFDDRGRQTLHVSFEGVVTQHITTMRL